MKEKKFFDLGYGHAVLKDSEYGAKEGLDLEIFEPSDLDAESGYCPPSHIKIYSDKKDKLKNFAYWILENLAE